MCIRDRINIDEAHAPPLLEGKLLLKVTVPVKSPTNAVEVIELNPVATPPVNDPVPSEITGNCTFFPATVDMISSSAKDFPAN